MTWYIHQMRFLLFLYELDKKLFHGSASLLKPRTTLNFCYITEVFFSAYFFLTFFFFYLILLPTHMYVLYLHVCGLPVLIGLIISPQQSEAAGLHEQTGFYQFNVLTSLLIIFFRRNYDDPLPYPSEWLHHDKTSIPQ